MKIISVQVPGSYRITYLALNNNKLQFANTIQEAYLKATSNFITLKK
jgi:hypothetical protein